MSKKADCMRLKCCYLYYMPIQHSSYYNDPDIRLWTSLHHGYIYQLYPPQLIHDQLTISVFVPFLHFKH